MKILFVGDPHVKKENLEESRRLLQWVASLARETGLLPVFAGDQYNDFGVARVEVLNFWRWAYSILPVGPRYGFGSISLVGNHDMNADGSLNFMAAHQDQTVVVHEPFHFGDHVFLPFYRNNEDFVTQVKARPVKSVVCHQEFNGAKYENGFYAPHGVDLASLPESVWFVSGHIHLEQVFGQVFYPGTARMLTRSDVGSVKGVHVIDLAERTSQRIDTPESVAKPFMAYTLREGAELPAIPDSDRVYVDVKGSEDFIKKTIKTLPGSVIVRALVEGQGKTAEIKESAGIPAAFSTFARGYFLDNKISEAEANEFMATIYERCPFLKTGVQ